MLIKQYRSPIDNTQKQEWQCQCHHCTGLVNSCLRKSSLHDIFVSSRFRLWFWQGNILSLFLMAKLLDRMVTGRTTQDSITMRGSAFVTMLRCNWSYAGGIFDVTACDQRVSSLSNLAISDEIYSKFLRSICFHNHQSHHPWSDSGTFLKSLQCFNSFPTCFHLSPFCRIFVYNDFNSKNSIHVNHNHLTDRIHDTKGLPPAQCAHLCSFSVEPGSRYSAQPVNGSASRCKNLINLSFTFSVQGNLLFIVHSQATKEVLTKRPLSCLMTHLEHTSYLSFFYTGKIFGE